VECPKGCYDEFKSKAQVVFGNKLAGFTFDSSICLAAMHAGLLSNASASFMSVELFKEDKLYRCSDVKNEFCLNNGIQSRSKE